MKDQFYDWWVVESANGYCKEGFPAGQTLCRGKDAMEEVSKRIDPENLILTKYTEIPKPKEKQNDL